MAAIAGGVKYSPRRDSDDWAVAAAAEAPDGRDYAQDAINWTGVSNAAIIVWGRRSDANRRNATANGPRRVVMSAEMESLMRAALLFGAIFALAAIVLEVGRRMRSRAERDKHAQHEMMTNFRELYERGGLSDEEFRTIKAKLARELKAELNDTGGKG
jgi:uncharacterized membrane protein